MQAIRDNDVDAVKVWIDGKKLIDRYVEFRDGRFIDGNADVNKKGMTALHCAAFFCKTEIVKMLLEADAGTLYVTMYMCVVQVSNLSFL